MNPVKSVKFLRSVSVIGALAGSLAALSLSLAPQAAQAERQFEACQYGVYNSSPSTENRTIEGRDYRFSIPENYTARLRQNGTIEVLDPDTVQYRDCIDRNDIGVGLDNGLTVAPISARVKEGSWPYNVPGFEWMQGLSAFAYGVVDSRHVVEFTHFSDYDSSYIWHGIENMPTGGAAHVASPVYDEDSEYVFWLAWLSLEPSGQNKQLQQGLPGGLSGGQGGNGAGRPRPKK